MDSIGATLGSACFSSAFSLRFFILPRVDVSLDLQCKNNKVHEMTIESLLCCCTSTGMHFEKYEMFIHSTKIESCLCHKHMGRLFFCFLHLHAFFVCQGLTCFLSQCQSPATNLRMNCKYMSAPSVVSYEKYKCCQREKKHLLFMKKKTFNLSTEMIEKW